MKFYQQQDGTLIRFLLRLYDMMRMKITKNEEVFIENPEMPTVFL